MSEVQAPVNAEEPIVSEWLYLADRAQQIYSGLVGLSDFGHWDTYFARTFDIYTKLWKFQQQHRVVLENSPHVGLQRYEIGDIATRIAQLYYHYYLRTSDISYLQEAFLFYEAVRTRNYFKIIDKTKNTTHLLVKQLRFYARFIVTCLLLDRRSVVHQLVEELTLVINEYSTVVRGGGETQEWHLVLQEITLFLQADVTAHFKDSTSDYTTESRLPRRSIFPWKKSVGSVPSTPTKVPDQALKVDPNTTSTTISTNNLVNVTPVVASSPPKNSVMRTENASNSLRLHSCLLVGCHQHQVKFSELSLDIYRMMFCLEREPSTAVRSGFEQGLPSLGTPRSKGKSINPLSNPKKFLLYRPSVSQLILYLASAQRELPENGVLLLYLSADGEAPKLIDPAYYNSPPTPGIMNFTPDPRSNSLNSSTSLNSNSLKNSSVMPSSGTSSIASSTSMIMAPPTTPMSSSSASIPASESAFSYPVAEMASVQLGSDQQNVDPQLSSFYMGGVRLRSETPSSASSSFACSKAFFAADLVPFTRRPLFLIVDSDNSRSFLNLPNVFAIPLMILVSPEASPPDLLEASQAGSLFTWYLHDPLSAFLFTSSKTSLAKQAYQQCQELMTNIILTLDEALQQENLPQAVSQFCNDDFLRMLILRFSFCFTVLKLRMSKSEMINDYLPASYPALPSSILENPKVISLIKELASLLGVTSMYD